MRSFLQKRRAAMVISSLTYNLTNLIYVIGYSVGLALGVYLYTQGQGQPGHGLPDRLLRRHAVRAAAEYPRTGRRPAAGVRQHPAHRRDLPHPAAGQQPAGSVPDRPHALLVRLSVAFENVAFHYDDNENVLHEIQFDIQPGRVLGILGRTGSGKSTLTRLLFRLYDPDHGSIRLGGVDLRQAQLTDLRQRVGMVTQDVQLFQASVRENLTFFNPESRDERTGGGADGPAPVGLGAARCRWAGYPAGRRRARAFRPGRRSCWPSARVFLKDPGLVILDEASSRLDPATENAHGAGRGPLVRRADRAW